MKVYYFWRYTNAPFEVWYRSSDPIEADDPRVEIMALANVDDIREVVDQQANDEGLWCEAETAPEAYLQQELRRLHRVIEND